MVRSKRTIKQELLPISKYLADCRSIIDLQLPPSHASSSSYHYSKTFRKSIFFFHPTSDSLERHTTDQMTYPL